MPSDRTLNFDPIAADRVAPGHAELASALYDRIRDGEFAVGARLPTETELCDTTGLSRYSVRRAIERLVDVGMVVRQPGIGSTVVSDRPATRYVQAMDTPADLAQYARETVLDVLEVDRVSIGRDSSMTVDVATGSQWWHRRGLRRTEGSTRRAIALVDQYVADAYGDLGSLSEQTETPLFHLIEQRYGVRVDRVEQTIGALVIDATSGHLLDADPGSAALRIVRRFYVRADLVEFTIGLHPADRFTYSTSYALETSR